MSTTEAEYVAASTAAREIVWLQKLLKDLECPCDKPILLHIDNQSAIKLVKNPEMHNRTKHIDIHFHYIREKYIERLLDVKYVSTEDQLADCLTKALPKDKFKSQLLKIGLSDLTSVKALE
jgi:hypothetical protein